MSEQIDEKARKRRIVIVTEPAPAARPPHRCDLGQHRWAWLTSGRQACGYCGRPR